MSPSPQKLDLTAPVSQLRRVGARTASRLERLGISTVRRLLWHIPSRYEDFSASMPIADAQVGETVSLLGTIKKIDSRVSWRRRRMTITTATLEDDSGTIRLVWFNQAFLADTLPVGTELSVAGKVRLDKQGPMLSSPVHEKPVASSGPLRHTGRLIPIYPETAGVTSKFLRYLIQPILEIATVEDYVPDDVRERRELLPLGEALTLLHYPAVPEDADRARRRLAFDDLLLFQIRALLQRRADRKVVATPVAFQESFMKKMVSGLPWKLTKGQKIALLEVLKDIERPFPMNRLLQGDVGSGKTAVALCGAMQVAQHGHQSVLLSPTETLAQQHYATARSLLGDHFKGVALLTGSQALVDGQSVERALLKKGIRDGKVTCVIGTHAIIQKDVRFGALAFVVVDEQHRFGIKQRAVLMQSERAGNGTVPHLLSMTATPIPRSLALTVFGDLDISTIREQPAGRKPITTTLVRPGDRDDMEDVVRKQVAAGQQVFIICPAIEEVTVELRQTKKGQQKLLLAEMKAVTAEYERLHTDVFPRLKIAMLHGRMKPQEKRSIMSKFRDGWYDILVSTSVIEVGVDVPNATVMIIENADRFGLAQLHQFRGRVGRGEHASACFLVPSEDSAGSERLKALVKSDDGFELAEKDLRLRGPGEFFGVKQSGMPDLTMAALADLELVKAARAEARTLLKNDPTLKAHSLLLKQLGHLMRLSHSE